LLGALYDLEMINVPGEEVEESALYIR